MAVFWQVLEGNFLVESPSTRYDDLNTLSWFLQDVMDYLDSWPFQCIFQDCSLVHHNWKGDCGCDLLYYRVSGRSGIRIQMGMSTFSFMSKSKSSGVGSKMSGIPKTACGPIPKTLSRACWLPKLKSIHPFLWKAAFTGTFHLLIRPCTASFPGKRPANMPQRDGPQLSLIGIRSSLERVMELVFVDIPSALSSERASRSSLVAFDWVVAFQARRRSSSNRCSTSALSSSSVREYVSPCSPKMNTGILNFATKA